MDNTVIDMLVVTWICLTILYLQKRMRCVTTEQAKHTADQSNNTLKRNTNTNEYDPVKSDLSEPFTENNKVKHRHDDMFYTETTGPGSHETHEDTVELQPSYSKDSNKTSNGTTEDTVELPPSYSNKTTYGTPEDTVELPPSYSKDSNKTTNGTTEDTVELPPTFSKDLNKTTNGTTEDTVKLPPTFSKDSNKTTYETTVSANPASNNINNSSDHLREHSQSQCLSNELKERCTDANRPIPLDTNTLVTEMDCNPKIAHRQSEGHNRLEIPEQASQNDSKRLNDTNEDTSNSVLGNSFQSRPILPIKDIHPTNSTITSSSGRNSDSENSMSDSNLSARTLKNDRGQLFVATARAKKPEEFSHQSMSSLEHMEINSLSNLKCYDSGTFSDITQQSHQDDLHDAVTTLENDSDSYLEYASSSQVDDSDAESIKYTKRNPNSRNEKTSDSKKGNKNEKLDKDVNILKPEKKGKPKSSKADNDISSAPLRFFNRFFSFDDVRNLDDKHIFD